MAIKLDFKPSTWEKAKPKDLKKESLTAALKDVDKTKGDDKKLAACIAALRQVTSAADDLMGGECSAKKNKELNDALKRLISDSDDEIKRLQEELDAAGEDEDEESGTPEEKLKKLLNKAKFSIFFKKAKGATTAEDGPGSVFCFHAKEAEKCELVLDLPSKIGSRCAKLKAKLCKLDSDYKKRNMVAGRAYRDDKFLVLECMPDEDGLPNVPGMDKKLRIWAKSHKADISPMKKVRMAIKGMPPIEFGMDELDAEAPESQAEETTASAAVPPKAPPSPTATAGVPPQAPPGPVKPEDAAKMEDRRKEFRKARQAWQAAKEKAIQDLEAVKDGIRDYYLDDPEMFKVATGKLSQLDGIMDNLGDDLRDILDKYVSTPKSRQDQLQQLASEASATVERFLSYVGSDALLNAVDNEQEMGLEKIKVREPLQKALRDLVNTLG